jgi:1-acyl-sn-glycerol-3-phosphate acyltransferase
MVPPPEGELIAWLGREPSGKASVGLRLFHGLARLLARPVMSMTIHGELPPAPAILVGAPHRRQRDVPAIGLALPANPRTWALVMGPGVMPGRALQRLIRSTGGMLPFWRGSGGIEAHVDAARRVLDAGAYLAMMPEGGITGPPDRLAEFRPGFALIAARTGAPVVPFIVRYDRVGRYRTRGRIELLPLRRIATPNGMERGSFAELRWAVQVGEALADEMEAVWLRA